MVFMDVLLNGLAPVVDDLLNSLDHIYLIEINMFLQMEAILSCCKLLVVHHKVLYWVPYCSLYIN